MTGGIPVKTTSPAGYSGTPLARKLGYREGSRVFVPGAPASYAAQLEPLPPGVVFVDTATAETDLVHVFVMERTVLATFLASMRATLGPEASIWVSWPKKASKVPTTITEDTIREIALPLGVVDIKVCAVDDVWSGLKLVVRKALR